MCKPYCSIMYFFRRIPPLRDSLKVTKMLFPVPTSAPIINSLVCHICLLFSRLRTSQFIHLQLLLQLLDPVTRPLWSGTLLPKPERSGLWVTQISSQVSIFLQVVPWWHLHPEIKQFDCGHPACEWEQMPTFEFQCIICILMHYTTCSLQKGRVDCVQSAHSECSKRSVLQRWPKAGHSFRWQVCESVGCRTEEIPLLSQPAHQLGTLCEVWDYACNLSGLSHKVRFLSLSLGLSLSGFHQMVVLLLPVVMIGRFVSGIHPHVSASTFSQTMEGENCALLFFARIFVFWVQVNLYFKSSV